MEAIADINIQEIEESRVHEADLDDPGFGRIFSDHMLEMRYKNGAWGRPEIKPFGPLEITPALNTLHYGQSVFEGTKAYYVNDRTINTFRLNKNYRRMRNSCERLCIPPVSEETFMESIRALIQLDYQWVPQEEGNALYIRPFACGWDPIIAARISDTYRFYVITSPVGDYYNRPVKLITSQKHVRAVKGGMGAAKTAGNYAGSLYPARLAHQKGYDQVLWLDAFEHRYIEEVGTMNIFFLIDDVLITPPLGGTILPGVTRDSVIKLTEKWGMEVQERRLSIDEVMNAADDGVLQEVFGAGTAAVIAPVQTICHDGQEATIHEEHRGPVGQKLYDTIYGIQTGQLKDPFGWVEPVSVG